jgi:hypothetical protein
VRHSELLAPVTSALEARFGEARTLITRFLAPDFYFDLDAIARRGLARREVEEVAGRALMGTGLVEKVYTQEDLLGEPPPGDAIFPLVRGSFSQPRSPHLSVVLKQWEYLSDRPGGTGHGTPWEYDRHIAVAFMGPGIKAGSYATECGPEDIAPTLGALLRLDYPLQDGRVLTEMMRGE